MIFQDLPYDVLGAIVGHMLTNTNGNGNGLTDVLNLRASCDAARIGVASSNRKELARSVCAHVYAQRVRDRELRLCNSAAVQADDVSADQELVEIAKEAREQAHRSYHEAFAIAMKPDFDARRNIRVAVLREICMHLDDLFRKDPNENPHEEFDLMALLPCFPEDSQHLKIEIEISE